MDLKKLIILVFLFLTGMSFAQQEKYTYCLPNGSVVIEKVDEQQVGDTIIKTFKQVNNGKQFKYYIFNNSIFSKYGGQYYLIGSNHAQIGDIWKPIWYSLNNYNDVDECTLQRSLKVVGIEQITVGSGYRLKYKLLVLDSLFNGDGNTYNPTPIYFYFIEGIGATSAGLFYNLAWQGRCHWITDIQTPTFGMYETDEYQYIESYCQTSAVNNTGELDDVNFRIENNYMYIQGVENENSNISFVDLTGKVVLQVTNQKEIDISSLKGLLIIKMETKRGSKINKFYFM